MELLSLGNVDIILCEDGGMSLNGIAISVMRQLLSVLNYLHTLDIIHRQKIQLDNLLVSSKDPFHIKLTDFEFSSCDGAPVSPAMLVLWLAQIR